MKFQKIYIELSDICGLNCEFCPAKKARRGVMGLENFEKIAKKIHNKARIFTFHILGDPLCLPDIKAYVEVAQKYNMSLELTSSAFYLDENIQKLLYEAKNIRQINFSLASFFSQNKKSFDEYTRPLLEFLSLDFKHKFVNLRLWNLDKNAEFLKTNERFYSLFEDFFKIKINTKEPRIRLKDYVILEQKYRFDWSFKNTVQESGYCHALSKQIGVLSNALLVPCCMDYDGVLSLGNLLDSDLDELLKGKKAMDMKEGFKKGILTQELCKKCSFAKPKPC